VLVPFLGGVSGGVIAIHPQWQRRHPPTLGLLPPRVSEDRVGVRPRREAIRPITLWCLSNA